MSKVVNNGEFTTKLKDDQFLRFADNSIMGVLIIQRGYLQYFNKKFQEIFGYSQEEILSWKKREFYKIVHPEDLPNLVQKFQIEDTKTVSIKFRGVTKASKIIPIENYVCKITYNNKSAFLSSYATLNNSIGNNNSNNKKVKIEIEIPDDLYNKLNNLYQVFKKSVKEILEKVCNDYIKDTINEVASML